MSTATLRRYLRFEESSVSTTALGSSLTPTSIRFRAYAASQTEARTAGDAGRRILNILVALAGLTLTAPLMLVIAVLIKLTSPGPVFYTQPRVGLDRRQRRGPEAENHRRKSDRGGRIFTIYKFRTMRPAGSSTPQVWAGENDPRITSIGRVLRAFRLDELPQLLNVLKGDMNIVGPRPEQPAIFQDLQQQLGRYRDRQRVLPGITGLAQVSLGYDTSVDDVKKKVALDLDYISRRSVGHDLVIMAKTIPVMVLRKGSM